MGTEQSTPAGPDLALGIPTGDLPDGHLLAGHVGDDGLLGQTKAVRGELAILGRCFHTIQPGNHMLARDRPYFRRLS